jgi:hypothetical protein
MTGWTICLGVNVGRSMATVSELRALCAKSLKYEELVSSVPKSLGPHARRKIRSLDEISTLWPTARSTAPASNRCRAWLISTRQLGQRIVAIEAVGRPKATTDKLARLISGRCHALSPGNLPHRATVTRGSRGPIQLRGPTGRLTAAMTAGHSLFSPLNASSSALASFRSSVSKPSANQP